MSGSSERGRSPLSPERGVTRLGRAQMEQVLAASAAAAGLVFGLQTIQPVLSQVPRLVPFWGAAVAVFVFALLACTLLATIFRRFFRLANAAFAVGYLVALLWWPAISLPGALDGERPWVYFFTNVATATAAFAFPVSIASAYTVLAPVLFGVIALLPQGGQLDPITAVLDVFFSMILGFFILVGMTVLRQASDVLDASQASALERYTALVRREAAEAERRQVDALVHDSVLTTLLAAARATSPEQQRLVVQMARTAIANIDGDALTNARTVSTRRFADDLIAAVSELPVDFAVQTIGVGVGLVPASVADAVGGAALQAAVNSVQHAGPCARTLLIRRSADGSLVVQVSDRGRGFDPDRVPAERLGIRISIGERVAAVGGTVRIDSQPGSGTTVTLTWNGDPTTDGVEPEAVPLARSAPVAERGGDA